MATADLITDGLLSCFLPLLAWRVLIANDLPQSVVLFISSGLLMALAWTRLGAPDVALVEAAVGAGLTGALLMSAFRWMRRPPSPQLLPRPMRTSFAVLLVAFALVMAWVVTALPGHGSGLNDTVLAHLEQSGVSHPVTAVLLSFRGYDTLLEVAVLLIATHAVQAQLTGGRRAVDAGSNGPMLPALVRLLIPGLVLSAGCLLWSGSHAPGGAFQAGAILGGGGILLILSGTIERPVLSSLLVRALLSIGPAIFVGVATAPVIADAGLLAYPPAWASVLILCIESALTLSIALMLILFFPGPLPSGDTKPAPQRERKA